MAGLALAIGAGGITVVLMALRAHDARRPDSPLAGPTPTYGSLGSSPVPATPTGPFVPPVSRSGGETVMQVTFPDGSTATLTYPRTVPALETGRVQAFTSFVAGCPSDITILTGIDSALREGEGPVRFFPGGEGTRVDLYEHASGTYPTHLLVFRLLHWTIETSVDLDDAERCAALLGGRVDDRGWLVLEAEEPARLARAGDHAGPEIALFGVGDAEAHVLLFADPGCEPVRDPSGEPILVGGEEAGSLTALAGSEQRFASWCAHEDLRIHASGSESFVRSVVEDLRVRRVRIAS